MFLSPLGTFLATYLPNKYVCVGKVVAFSLSSWFLGLCQLAAVLHDYTVAMKNLAGSWCPTILSRYARVTFFSSEMVASILRK